MSRRGQTSRWRDGGSSAEWPSEWPSPAEAWPKPRSDGWTPDHEGHALIACLREHEATTITEWADAVEAEIADADLYITPCSVGCRGRHLRIWAEPGQLHVERGFHDPPPVPADLGKALRAAGYRPPRGTTLYDAKPEDWPHPTCWNPPLNGGR